MSRNYIQIGKYVSVGVKTPEGIDRGAVPKVEINWSALGSVDIATAREFSNSLRRAINRAQKELRLVRARFTSNPTENRTRHLVPGTVPPVVELPNSESEGT